MMQRRQLIGLLAGAAAACPLGVGAQRNERVPMVATLVPYREDDSEAQMELAAFRDALAQLGFAAGSGVLIEERWAGGDFGKLRAAARELVNLSPAVIVTRSTGVTATVLYETRTIPVVFVAISDPVGDGFVLSMGRPGSNATGFTNVAAAVGGTWLELLKELNPSMRQVAVLFGPNAPGGGSYFMPSIQAAAKSSGVSLVPVLIVGPRVIDHEIAVFARQPHGGLIVTPDVTTTAHRSDIIGAAARHRVPAMYPYPHFAAEGGLAAYGIDVAEQYRRAAEYVAKILRGEKPRQLPVQQPTAVDLAINLKTAQALGVVVPPALRARAAQVIE
jgi:putative ABC transport system substrate-binding protein